ncbi:fructose-bisphospatase II [Toxoplasma gondii ARI]|uniref:fructose-bisphosphatase n=2 Tax=Toxoplasma gondii TaxID=5811 RepID=A0A2G8YBM3_TOXGO|nr:fructose-bisphospatase II [Toxoplasma gondii ARI]PIM04661.1 fructose-bisphospatase II [Toxoplasma gondii COUG]
MRQCFIDEDFRLSLRFLATTSTVFFRRHCHTMAASGHPIPELGEFIIANKEKLRNTGQESEMNRLLTAIKLAAKVVNREINKAGLADILGAAGNQNVQGEEQQKLDVFANHKFIQALVNREVVCGICTEEDDDFIEVNRDAHFVMLMDPLDGSSNIDVNVSVGTIFSIYQRVSPLGSPPELRDFLQPGNAQIAAGYVLYGSSTMLVMTTGDGVNGFTLDPSLGTFFLSHRGMRFPEKARIYSVNEGNYKAFPDGIKKFLEECHDDKTGPFSLRYIGSLVSDFHRNLLQGGIYMYPPTKKDKKGKLRLLYEANPMAFLAEQAGGKATDGFDRIMDIQPSELHQRVPLMIGTARLVDRVDALMVEHSPECRLHANCLVGKNSS